ncbi:MAG: hypothetical protein AW07_01190 [Candidatus Accumulibacter sp. SK-11]|nr:MAG: hypothetical protein AW07_01190 [Candidatus Accumulibacter sp. SK-11]
MAALVDLPDERPQTAGPTALTGTGRLAILAAMPPITSPDGSAALPR